MNLKALGKEYLLKSIPLSILHPAGRGEGDRGRGQEGRRAMRREGEREGEREGGREICITFMVQ